MKIVTQTQDQMVVQDGGWSNFLGGIVVMGAMAFIGSKIGVNLTGIFSGKDNVEILFLGVPFLIGLCMTLTSSWYTVILDKAQGQVSFIKKGILGTKIQTAALANVAKVELRRSQVDTKNGTSSRYQLLLVFKDGSEIPLDHRTGSSNIGLRINNIPIPLGSSAPGTSIGEQVAVFLGVPYQAPPTLGQVFQTVKKLWEARGNTAEQAQILQGTLPPNEKAVVDGSGKVQIQQN